jgi:hypothetical protein
MTTSCQHLEACYHQVTTFYLRGESTSPTKAFSNGEKESSPESERAFIIHYVEDESSKKLTTAWQRTTRIKPHSVVAHDLRGSETDLAKMASSVIGGHFFQMNVGGSFLLGGVNPEATLLLTTQIAIARRSLECKRGEHCPPSCKRRKHGEIPKRPIADSTRFQCSWFRILIMPGEIKSRCFGQRLGGSFAEVLSMNDAGSNRFEITPFMPQLCRTEDAPATRQGKMPYLRRVEI